MRADSFLVGVGIFCLILASFVGTANAQVIETGGHNSNKYNCGANQTADGDCTTAAAGQACCTACAAAKCQTYQYSTSVSCKCSNHD